MSGIEERAAGNIDLRYSIRHFKTVCRDLFYTFILSDSDMHFLSYFIMSESFGMTQELDPQKFWQIHRATIVNVSRIEDVSRSLTGRGILKLKNRKEALTVSRQYLHLFKQI